MTPSIRIEGAEQPLTDDNIPYPLKTAARPFLFHKKHRVMLIGRIIHRHDQIPLLTRNPFVSAAILMEHHTRQRNSLPALPVNTSLRNRGNNPLRLKTVLHPRVTPCPLSCTVLPVEMPHTPSPVPLEIGRAHV